MVQPRIGQGAFRVIVTDAYHRRCAITGEKTMPVLDAAHIKPYSQNGPNLTNNGLLLRRDIHTLFDRGYITINEEYRVEVSYQIKDDYGNGREYYTLHGKNWSKCLRLKKNDHLLNFFYGIRRICFWHSLYIHYKDVRLNLDKI